MSPKLIFAIDLSFGLGRFKFIGWNRDKTFLLVDFSTCLPTLSDIVINLSHVFKKTYEVAFQKEPFHDYPNYQ